MIDPERRTVAQHPQELVNGSSDLFEGPLTCGYRAVYRGYTLVDRRYGLGWYKIGQDAWET